ncbi:methyltransferase [Sorangium sp. So ce216]
MSLLFVHFRLLSSAFVALTASRGCNGAAWLYAQLASGSDLEVHRAVVEAYDFSGVRRLVDVGGGHGALLAAILSRHPEVRGVVFDQPHVVRGAHANLERAGVAARCELMGGDFFCSVPGGADAYILSAIIHDWSDEDAVLLLKNIRRAIAGGGRLLLVESVIQPGSTPDFGKLLDLEMLIACGGRERTEPEIRALLAAAGFRLARVFPTASATSVIEAVPAWRGATGRGAARGALQAPGTASPLVRRGTIHRAARSMRDPETFVEGAPAGPAAPFRRRTGGRTASSCPAPGQVGCRGGTAGGRCPACPLDELHVAEQRGARIAEGVLFAWRMAPLMLSCLAAKQIPPPADYSFPNIPRGKPPGVGQLLPSCFFFVTRARRCGLLPAWSCAPSPRSRDSSMKSEATPGFQCCTSRPGSPGPAAAPWREIPGRGGRAPLQHYPT